MSFYSDVADILGSTSTSLGQTYVCPTYVGHVADAAESVQLVYLLLFFYCYRYYCCNFLILDTVEGMDG